MNKTDLLEYLIETSSAMTRCDMDDAILLHFDLVMENYRQKPLFYKNLLKYDRFMVALSLLSFNYKDHLVPLSKVKAFCQERGYLSRNSLDSYFSFFFIAGYMQVRMHDEDSRQRVFTPTGAALCETTRMIKSYLLPSQLIVPYDGCLKDAWESEDMLRVFFHGFAKLLEADVMLDKLLPEAKWIMNRDGGHLPMLALYVDSLRKDSIQAGYKVSTYIELSSRLGVSKTHIIRMVREGELHGYFKCHKNTVELLPAFLDLVRRTMAINFSVARISLKLGMGDSEFNDKYPRAKSLLGL